MMTLEPDTVTLLVAIGGLVAFLLSRGQREGQALATIHRVDAATSPARYLTASDLDAIASRLSNLERTRQDDRKDFDQIEKQLRTIEVAFGRIEERLLGMATAIDRMGARNAG